MMTIFASIFLLLGAAFALFAAIGIVRMPDIYCRMHAATKAGAFGLSLMLVGVVFANPTLRVAIQCVMIIGFFYLTAPVAAHMISRVAIRRGIPLWRSPTETVKPKPINPKASDQS